MWKSPRRIALFSTVLVLGGAALIGVVLLTDWLPVEFREPDTGRLAGTGIPGDLDWATIDDVSTGNDESAVPFREQSEPAVDAANESATGFRTRVEQFVQSDDLPPASFEDRRDSFDVDSRFPDRFPEYGNSSRPAVSSNAAPNRNVSVAAPSDLAGEPLPLQSNFDGEHFSADEPFRNAARRRGLDPRAFPSERPRRSEQLRSPELSRDSERSRERIGTGTRNEVAPGDSILLTAASDAASSAANVSTAESERESPDAPASGRGTATPPENSADVRASNDSTTAGEVPDTNAANRIAARTTARGGQAAARDRTATDRAAEKIAAIDTLLDDGDYIIAHREMSSIYWRQPELRSLIMDRLNRNAATIYFNPQPHFLQPYELRSGDLLQRVAPKYRLSWQYLAKLNRISDPSRIRAGQKLKVIKGPFSAFVDLSDFELTVHAHGFFVKRYPIGIGRDGTSPIGKFQVLEKIPTPQYTDPEGRVIAGGAPDNPLGPFWLDLGDSYGIHGTIDPDSIGKAESRGCIRMRNEDVAEVYDFLITGSEVVIRP